LISLLRPNMKPTLQSLQTLQTVRQQSQQQRSVLSLYNSL